MITSPFSLFEQFQDKLDVRLIRKEDMIQDDAGTETLLGSSVASVNQVHGSRILRVSEPEFSEEKADGIVTDIPGFFLTARSADCQTFVVYAPKQHVTGVMHVGWRGLVAHTITSFYDSLNQEWGIKPEETFVGAAPSLGLECAEFTDPLKELPTLPSKFFHGRLVDLQGIADDEFESLGVPASQRERMPECTKCQKDRYWSYRGEKEAVVQGYRNVLCCALL
jgi:copper oxidase (laccase) domain-containing protein